MVEVIAEIGSCHDGSLDQALELIQTAKDCGANIVKAQYWSSAARMAQRRKAPEYEAIYRRYQVPETWLPVLAAEAKRVGLVFACSSYLPEDVDTVARHAEILKISSFEANDRALLMAHVPYCGSKRIIVSMGLNASMQPQSVLAPHIERLHCVTAYPAPLGSLALGWLHDMYAGYSDHSGDIRVGGWAVAAGARIIEAHLRLDETNNENPDAGPHALCPVAFDAYIREIRDVEQALCGDPTQAEAAMARYAVR
jgi:N,N'-diacetyllegionaminate synthase